MDGLSLLAEARRAGLRLEVDGDRLMIRGPRRAEPIARRLIEAKPAVVEALRVTERGRETLARSPLVARVRAAWPWIAEHRSDLFRAISDADYADDLERLRSAMEEASRVYEQRQRAEAVRIYSRVLDCELWIAPDEEAAEQLRRDGETLPILLPSEAMILGRMAEADARDLFAVLAKVQAIMPGARLRGFDEDGDA